MANSKHDAKPGAPDAEDGKEGTEPLAVTINPDPATPGDLTENAKLARDPAASGARTQQERDRIRQQAATSEEQGDEGGPAGEKLAAVTVGTDPSARTEEDEDAADAEGVVIVADAGMETTTEVMTGPVDDDEEENKPAAKSGPSVPAPRSTVLRPKT